MFEAFALVGEYYTLRCSLRCIHNGRVPSKHCCRLQDKSSNTSQASLYCFSNIFTVLSGLPCALLSRMRPTKPSMNLPGLTPDTTMMSLIDFLLGGCGPKLLSAASLSAACLRSEFWDLSKAARRKLLRRLGSTTIARLFTICVSADMACEGGTVVRAERSSSTPIRRTISRALHSRISSFHSGTSAMRSISSMSCPTASAISSGEQEGILSPSPPPTDVDRIRFRCSSVGSRTIRSTTCIEGGSFEVSAARTSSRTKVSICISCLSPRASAARMYAASAAMKLASRSFKRFLIAPLSASDWVSSGSSPNTSAVATSTNIVSLISRRISSIVLEALSTASTASSTSSASLAAPRTPCCTTFLAFFVLICKGERNELSNWADRPRRAAHTTLCLCAMA
mmetsp:Transcript_3553/g.6017  ORF Transcript_3553/g.6017 Transcript_3553/m.6017 type:complete len:397 (-) Transcript_3553:200-1390(-)